MVLVPQSRDATCERLPSFVGCVGATSTASSLRSAVVDRAHTEPTQAYFTGVTLNFRRVNTGRMAVLGTV